MTITEAQMLPPRAQKTLFLPGRQQIRYLLNSTIAPSVGASSYSLDVQAGWPQPHWISGVVPAPSQYALQ